MLAKSRTYYYQRYSHLSHICVHEQNHRPWNHTFKMLCSWSRVDGKINQHRHWDRFVLNSTCLSLVLELLLATFWLHLDQYTLLSKLSLIKLLRVPL
jgi:hypothetical protein